MTDYTKKPHRNGGVNGGMPDAAAWDHKPGDPARPGWRDPGTHADVRMSEVNQPSSHDGLPEAEEALLREWILRELRPAGVEGRFCTYGLKHICERMTGCYSTNGAFKGAMLDAGFEPVDRFALTWKFGYAEAEKKLFERSCGRIA